jgi:hypothetical protein
MVKPGIPGIQGVSRFLLFEQNPIHMP